MYEQLIEAIKAKIFMLEGDALMYENTNEPKLAASVKHTIKILEDLLPTTKNNN